MATKEFDPLTLGAAPVKQEFDPTSFGATPVQSSEQQTKEPLLNRLSRYADNVFGAGKIGEAIGTGIGYYTTPKEYRAAYDTSIPSAGQLAGSALQSASLFIPGGRVAGVAAKGLGFLGKAAPLAGRIASGALAGESFDVASNLQQGKTGTEAFSPGAGTAIGSLIPVVGPTLGAVTRGVAEGLGASTGTGYGAIKGAFEAARVGGAKGSAFVKSLRGNITPDQIVNEAKDGLDQIIAKRSQNYTTQLEKLKANTKTFDTSPVITKFNEQLDKFGVDALPDGTPDLSRAPGLARYQNDLLRLSKVLADWGKKPGDNTLVGIDKLKQTIDDFRIGSQDSKKFDSFVTTLRNEAQGLIKDQPGYKKLVEDYAEKTGLIKEISRGLSLNDRAMVDTSFRKLSTVLRTNNEFRKQLVDELERYSPTISSKIAGQQLSEKLPRGLARQFATYGGGAGLLSGIGIVPLAKALILTSPRVVGEFINVLGLTAKQADKLKNIMGIRSDFPTFQLIRPTMTDNSQFQTDQPRLKSNQVPEKTLVP